jgi:GR25 family glycosyltransferase involved in LPS biosynthesis
MEKKYILLLVIILLVIGYYNRIFYQYENFDSISDNIDFYVITLGKTERLNNIHFQNTKLGENLIITNAVNGLFLNQNQLLQNGELSQNFYDGTSIKRNKEIGCYKSHFNIYNSINKNKKYSIILEDDFNIISVNIKEQLQKLMNDLDNMDFDIIFLGNTFKNNTDTPFKNNIYNIDKNKFTIGTYAYLINNKNISKLINLTKNIDSPIDNKIDTLIKNDLIKAFVVIPNLINYMVELKSDIL